MLRWSLAFFVVAIIAGVLGFGNISGASLDIAKFLFFISLIPAIILLVAGIFFVSGSK